MSVLRPEAFAKAERLTVQAATKLTPSEHQDARDVLDALRAEGLEEVTLSSLYRTAIVTFVRAYKAEHDEAERKDSRASE